MTAGEALPPPGLRPQEQAPDQAMIVKEKPRRRAILHPSVLPATVSVEALLRRNERTTALGEELAFCFGKPPPPTLPVKAKSAWRKRRSLVR